jgi:hypothetical protein
MRDDPIDGVEKPCCVANAGSSATADGMRDSLLDKPERLHRPELDRDEPLRDVMSYIRNSGSGGQTKAAPSPHTEGETPDEAVAHGVKLGYAVIDDQIRQGEKLAERLRQVNGKAGAMPHAEVGTLIERALNLYKDMGALTVAVLETLVRNPIIQSGVTRALNGTAASQTSTVPDGGTNFRFELASNRRIRVKLDIRPQGVKFMPLVHALQAVNPAIPPLTGVRFHLDSATMTPTLVVEVADGQPPGSYAGVVVDSVTNEPCGTLSVRILP